MEVGIGVLDLQLLKTALSSPSCSLQSLPANNYIIERMGENTPQKTKNGHVAVLRDSEPCKAEGHS